MLSVMAIFIGAILGMRFRVFILLPATAVFVLAALWEGLARQDSVGSVLLSVSAAILAVNLGYIGGMFVRLRDKSINSPAKARTHPSETLSA